MAAGVLPSRPMSKWFCTLALLLASTAHAVHATPTTSSPETNDVVDHWMMNPPEVIDRWLAPQKTKPVVASAQIDSVADRWMMNPHEVIDRWMNQGSAKATDKASSMMSQLDAARNDVADKTADLVTTAMGLLGVPYRRGGNSAETGFDCSGFVRSIYSQTVGMVLPRRAVEQAAATQTIDKKELQPGDLVFFNTMRRTFSHVGIYIGDGKFVHSPRTGKTVRVESMQDSYWKKRFNGARRVVDYSLTAQVQ